LSTATCQIFVFNLLLVIAVVVAVVVAVAVAFVVTLAHVESLGTFNYVPVAMIVCHLQFEIVQYFIVKWDN